MRLTPHLLKSSNGTASRWRRFAIPWLVSREGVPGYLPPGRRAVTGRREYVARHGAV